MRVGAGEEDSDTGEGNAVIKWPVWHEDRIADLDRSSHNEDWQKTRETLNAWAAELRRRFFERKYKIMDREKSQFVLGLRPKPYPFAPLVLSIGKHRGRLRIRWALKYKTRGKLIQFLSANKIAGTDQALLRKHATPEEFEMVQSIEEEARAILAFYRKIIAAEKKNAEVKEAGDRLLGFWATFTPNLHGDSRVQESL